MRGAPDVDAMIAWLGSEAVGPQGEVWSWVNASHPGYPYPEAAGLWLTVMATARPESRALPAVARWLEDQLGSSGAVGRDGVEYAFDTAIALTGLLAAARAGRFSPSPRVLELGVRRLEEALDLRRATTPVVETSRWSTRWSWHQLKLAVGLTAVEEVLRRPQRARLRALAASVTGPLTTGGFPVSAGEACSYVHAGCYALEGLVALERAGAMTGAQHLHCGAQWLAALQLPTGELPAWHPTRADDPRRPSDVIAQAVRLWALVDRDRYAEPIARACAELARRQTADGAIRYLRDADDRNTWCTVFALQAVRWATVPPSPGEWIA